MMRNFRLDSLRLRADLLLARQGVWPFVVAALGVLLLLVLAVFLPGGLTAADEAAAEVRRLRSELAALEAKPEAERQAMSPAQTLARVLVDPAESPAQIRSLLDLARNQGLQIVQVDYRRLNESAEYSELQVVMPVKGNYPALRRFLLEALAALPALSLEQLVIKREQAEAEQIDAQVLLTIWQKPASGAVEGRP